MGARDPLLDLLRQKKNEDKAAEAEWQKKKDEWLNDLHDLGAKIRAWLKSALKEGLVQIGDTEQMSITEPYIGTYEAPVLKIRSIPHGREIVIEPKGVNTAGGQGRVDLRCGPSRAMLVRVERGKWRFAHPTAGANWEMKDLTNESFSETLARLLE